MANVLLAASASVSVYKACDLASKLSQAGHTVRAVLTANAAKLVSPQLFEAVTGQPAFVSEWGENRRAAMDHIDLAKFAELVVVAPCSANLAARLAHGFADDLVSTALLAVAPGVPRLVCPAMNPNMLQQPAVQRNFDQLRADGWQFVEAEAGHMACGDHGTGRLAEPQAILRAVEFVLTSKP
ncbi:Phosphopantothenoylcysteine decarboxylase [Planctomycetes bacterium Poly30]|uniref:Phosphopantothenoylcysteine decarboxylase n=1 Tax=Saltatorellus ferox TaxID=2528018 RepID=A0A518F086_9BACT|nr:Phosphopantothenoylcysteine decarboxylase [Planctomycetes bacterium Poly30]